MSTVLVIGSGIAGMACAVRCAEHGLQVILASPYPSERAQSVMASGGINAVTDSCENGDSIACHVQDTLKGGCFLAGEQAVSGLCGQAGEIVRYLERIGTVFSLNEAGKPARRAFGGQSHKRTYYCGASTGKQIVSALVMEVRRLEAAGRIERRLALFFHSGLIRDGVCYGAIFFNRQSGRLEAVYADAVVMATGGQNDLFGKTTGSTLCDGYAAGKLFLQGAELKNLEFIQYHPTTLETSQKRMLVSEAARGEGGRLFYEADGRRCYFMEKKYGPDGNLQTRDVISREMEAVGKQIYLDVSFLGDELIRRRLPEVRDICLKYRGIDITKEPIPVVPSVHFFMGGLAVHGNHETNIRRLFGVGECASLYHGANRLGGNSLLAAVHSGWTAADEAAGRPQEKRSADFSSELKREDSLLQKHLTSESPFPAAYIRDMLAESMAENLGIVRHEAALRKGIEDVEQDLEIARHIRFDPVTPYTNYSLTGILTLARAVLTCALERRESRGAHFRKDYPDPDEAMRAASVIAYDDGAYTFRLDKEHAYEV